jgi:hypothetical protein
MKGSIRPVVAIFVGADNLSKKRRYSKFFPLFHGIGPTEPDNDKKLI